MKLVEPTLMAFPLRGLQLIEASAGTGKTWTIANLVLRLLLEQGLPIEQILVVTYTKAATAELRERLRMRLAEARDWLHYGESDDPVGRVLLKRIPAGEGRFRALTRLDYALRGFDEAAIFTIHGFCQRVLGDVALEAGVPFEQTLLTDDSALLLELIADQWRRLVHDAHPLLLQWLLDQHVTPYSLLRALRAHIGKPWLQVSAPDAGELEVRWQRCSAHYLQCRTLWLSEAETIATLLSSPALKKNIYREDWCLQWLARTDSWLRPAQAHTQELFEKADRLTQDSLSASCKAGSEAPTHPFFLAWQALLIAYKALAQALEQRFQHVLAQLYRHCQSALPQRKEVEGVLSYDDLLNRLAQALEGPAAAFLRQRVRQRFPAALIDEFQDTDPVQYRIFHHLYGDDDAVAWLVGDPKQAIYSFRGADVFTYLEARQDAGQHHSLGVNHRSDEALVAAVNRLFSRPQPFLLPGITFQPVDAARRAPSALHCGAQQMAPLQWRLLPAEGAALSKEEASRRSAQHAASEMVRLLSDPAVTLEGRRLHGGDIAVLVPSHRQGSLMAEALRERGVPCVQQATRNVFFTEEAIALRTLLAAVLQPNRQSTLTAALCSPWFGLEGAALWHLRESPERWEQQVEDFNRYHQLWREQGFLPMARQLMDERRVAEQLLRLQDGERRLTNVLHLLELTQAESHVHLGMDSLYRWFCDQTLQPDGSQDEALIRLESDAQRIRIVTIHASKGLEYPVVFCPFAWDGKLLQRHEQDLLSCRDEAGVATLYLGASADARNRAESERFAEQLRLLYVALTRARHRCYLYWGWVKDAGRAALSWLLHTTAETLPAHLAATESLDQSGWQTLLADWQARMGEHMHWQLADDVSPSRWQANVSTPQIEVAQFGRHLRSQWQMSSFTALTRNLSAAHIELPDHDGRTQPQPAESVTPATGMFAFPKGARPGTFLHSLFEQIDFCAVRPDWQPVVHSLLAGQGYEAHWEPVLLDMLQATLQQPLDEAGGCLAQVTPRERLVELEFTFPQPALSMSQLAQLLARPELALPAPSRRALGQLTQQTAAGYLKGYVDLICRINNKFYVIDYKSNWLGNRAEDYAAPRLEQAIAHEHYYLQYLLYTLALHRYLQQRLPGYQYEQHMGGVRYLFLRGTATGQPGCGVYSDRPSLAMIEALDAFFAEEVT